MAEPRTRYEVLRFEPPKAGKAKSFTVYFHADPISRVEAIKSGIPAAFVDEIAAEMGRSKEWLLPTLGLSTATFNRRKSESKPLSKDESERVLGIARLVGQVEAMVKESGNLAGFSAAQWVARWLEEPLPALGGRKPGELMDTAEGQSIVSNVLARAQSGAYA
ncbi:MAG TPA: antitoxin Xre-like helix-turn-helix domain-containing protein [Ramlibacter sp.]|uniref:type II RES/Xre toxin-antitoxin system antitoxin n=1 Tax=Ramlibacter sp. TaxID=1917967 RepID=UPI002ED5B7F2